MASSRSLTQVFSLSISPSGTPAAEDDIIMIYRSHDEATENCDMDISRPPPTLRPRKCFGGTD
eukprot:scaffold23326_cov63-Skeletonema_menzelii.AAC.1